jgi:hypothetical protein
MQGRARGSPAGSRHRKESAHVGEHADELKLLRRRPPHARAPQEAARGCLDARRRLVPPEGGGAAAAADGGRPARARAAALAQLLLPPARGRGRGALARLAPALVGGNHQEGLAQRQRRAGVDRPRRVRPPRWLRLLQRSRALLRRRLCLPGCRVRAATCLRAGLTLVGWPRRILSLLLLPLPPPHHSLWRRRPCRFRRASTAVTPATVVAAAVHAVLFQQRPQELVAVLQLLRMGFLCVWSTNRYEQSEIRGGGGRRGQASSAR